MHYTFWSHRREGVTKCVTLSQRLPFSIAFLQSYLKRDGDESISKGSVNIQNNNFWTAKVQPGRFPEAEQIPEVTREATPLTVLLYSPSCGPAQGQPDPGTARSQRAAPPSQTLLIPNSSLLGSRVFLSGTHPYGTWIIFCQERIRQYYLRPVNWPDSQRKLGSAGWVLPASKGLLHAVRTRLLARSESPSAPLHVFAQFFVSEALAVHKFAYVPFFFFYLHIYSKEILSQEYPPLPSSSHKLGQVSGPLALCWTELVFHIINYNYLSSKGIKKPSSNFWLRQTHRKEPYLHIPAAFSLPTLQSYRAQLSKAEGESAAARSGRTAAISGLLKRGGGSLGCIPRTPEQAPVLVPRV